jgi:hypothetical protein
MIVHGLSLKAFSLRSICLSSNSAITVTQISHNFQQDRQLFNRVLKNEHQDVSQGARRFGKRSISADM